ncbi:uncharacterized protein A1O9_05062 [Exophiala aquamarina CBS 119918]|uniref:L-asparaginase n=1 Tax=Exophiala aquamarina CBS 119918 TaxID=1182545 RepID=A0A072PKD2_9EURO|nr:uncharacterized protein A1O9_05062 [Exophiala aquamarina CBS 119918]KEF60212.1 hypothetical protein A1O9_05062 [Exophiala aquamarina CBS 119918]
MTPAEKSPIIRLGPYRPTVILHGGAGALSRDKLPPELYARYHASLLEYLTRTRKLLDSGASALDAATYAVTLFEDDPLFNCGRGAVFTDKGTIELEASIMVTSLNPDGPPVGAVKRAAAVSLVKNTRHPILLAKEVLTASDKDQGLGGTSTMHCHLSGRELEEWGWSECGLEKKSDSWFWTKKRWDEHRRLLHPDTRSLDRYTFEDLLASADPLSQLRRDDADIDIDFVEVPSQGTVGAVALDSWGNLATATSTGGLTNKRSGRIGDTPTVGAGFWAEAWEEHVPNITPGLQIGVAYPKRRLLEQASDFLYKYTKALLGPCLDPLRLEGENSYHYINGAPPSYSSVVENSFITQPFTSHPTPTVRGEVKQRRAVALSGTGNGDSFLRTNAVRTSASISRFSPHYVPLSDAVKLIAGKNGELQRSAADRWGRTGEGQGGIIGIEVTDNAAHGSNHSSTGKRGKAVFDFNCGGLFRAYYEDSQEVDGKEVPKVAVFREDY